MKRVNLRDLYPDVYKTDHFVDCLLYTSHPVRSPADCRSCWHHCGWSAWIRERASHWRKSGTAIYGCSKMSSQGGVMNELPKSRTSEIQAGNFK